MSNGGGGVIARPESDSGKVFSKFPVEHVPENAQLLVGNDEACLFLKDGAVVGILPPGQYVLSTQAFPVLSQLITPGPEGENMISCWIIFVFGQIIQGVQFGGKLSVPLAPGADGSTFVRGTFDFHVVDPGKLIQSIAGVGGDWGEIADHFPPPQVRAQIFAAVQTQVIKLVTRQRVALPEVPASLATPEIQQALGVELQETAQNLGIELTAVRIEAVEQQAAQTPPTPVMPPGQMQQPPTHQAGAQPQRRGFGGGAMVAGGVAAGGGATSPSHGGFGSAPRGSQPRGPDRSGPSEERWLNTGARVLGIYEGEWYEATVAQVQPEVALLNWDDGTSSMVSLGALRPSIMPGPSDLGPGLRVMAKYDEVVYECTVASLGPGGATINWDDGTQSWVLLHDIRLIR